MNEMTLDQNEEELFTYEVSDEVRKQFLLSGSVLLCIFALVLNGTPNRSVMSHSANQCPLSRVKRTSHLHREMSAFDPKRTSARSATDVRGAYMLSFQQMQVSAN